MKAYQSVKQVSVGSLFWVALLLFAVIVLATFLCYIVPAQGGDAVLIHVRDKTIRYDIGENRVVEYYGVLVYIQEGEVFAEYEGVRSRSIAKVGEVLNYPQSDVVVEVSR